MRRLIAAAPDAASGDVEGVHQMRVATRRLRSDLRTFRDLIDPSWARPLRDDLRRLGCVLGEVRELDVLTSRLQEAAGDDREALGPIFDRLNKPHADARCRLDATLASDWLTELKRG